MITTSVATSLDLNEASAFLGLPPDTLRERAASGIVPGVKLGKEWRFVDVDLLTYMRAQYAPSPSAKTMPANSEPPVFATPAEALDDLLGLPKNGKNNVQLRRKRIAEL